MVISFLCVLIMADMFGCHNGILSLYLFMVISFLCVLIMADMIGCHNGILSLPKRFRIYSNTVREICGSDQDTNYLQRLSADDIICRWLKRVKSRIMDISSHALKHRLIHYD